MTQVNKIMQFLLNELTQEEKEIFLEQIKSDSELALKVKTMKKRILMKALVDAELQNEEVMANEGEAKNLQLLPKKRSVLSVLTHWRIGLAAASVLVLVVISLWWSQRQDIPGFVRTDQPEQPDTVKQQEIDAPILVNEPPPNMANPIKKLPKGQSVTDLAIISFEKSKPKLIINQNSVEPGNFGAGSDLEMAKAAWMKDSMQLVLRLTDEVSASSALYLRGLAYLQLGNPQQAESLFSRILESKYERYSEDWWNKDDVEWYLILARLEAGTGTKEELKNIFTKKSHKHCNVADELYKRIH